MLDEIYFPGNFEDDDYCFRIINAEYKLLLCHDTFVHHYGSASFSTDSSYNEILQKNKRKFEEKWNIDISDVYFNLAYLAIIPEINDLKVLDIYGNCGVNGLMLKFHRKNIDFYIGNNNNGSYKIASKLLKTFSMDSIDINFDYILINNDAKFLKDVLAKSLLFKALKSSKNIALFINPSLYTNYTSENSKNLSLLIYYLKTKFNFILNNEISYGNNRINIFTNKFIN